jgi:hypothetical protein
LAVRSGNTDSGQQEGKKDQDHPAWEGGTLQGLSLFASAVDGCSIGRIRVRVKPKGLWAVSQCGLLEHTTQIGTPPGFPGQEGHSRERGEDRKGCPMELVQYESIPGHPGQYRGRVF